MKDAGYGVQQNGKPVGILPIGLEAAQISARRYKESDPGTTVDVVPVFAGEPIAVTARPATTRTA